MHCPGSSLRKCGIVPVQCSKAVIWCNRYGVGAFVVRWRLLTGPQAQALLLRWRPATAGTAALASLLQTFPHALVIFFKLLFLIIVQNNFGL